MYLDEADKPDIGEGLNKAAEVTLHKVHRIDKATNRPTADPDAIARFERKLKKLAADQNARFISYDPDPGTWIFEVNHFSRCGICRLLQACLSIALHKIKGDEVRALRVQQDVLPYWVWAIVTCTQ